MAAADVVITGTVLTVDDARPTAEALAVADGRIVAVGSRSDVAGFVGAHTRTIDVGDGCVMPGFIEAHGHPLMEALALSDRIVDIRPVTLPDADDVVAAVRREVAARGAAGAYLNGWDPLLQSGLPEPTLGWLDDIAPDGPLVIIHNSGHKAYFNSLAARRADLTRDTPDPKGAKYGRDAHGNLDGTAEEIAAVFPLLGAAIQADSYPAMLLDECARLNRAGLTTCSEMAFDPNFGPLVERLRDELTVRLRTYEVSNPQMHTDATPGQGDDMLRQVGIKIWVDGSPWIGNIALSFPYLDTAATRTIGVHARLVRMRQLHRRPTAPRSSARTTRWAGRWPATCRATPASTPSSTSTKRRCAAIPRDDHRLRLEHVGAIRPEQLQRAADLGVTCSIFVDQIHYWGDIIVDGLFGPERGSRWMPAGSAVATGMRISLHNDPPVTPEEPLRNISVAVTRTDAQRPGAGARGAADGRAGDPRADHRRRLAAVRRRRDRLD